MAFYSGKSGLFTYAAVSYPMNKWTADIDVGKVDYTNFKSSGGWRQFLQGFKSGTITAEGPIDTALAAFDMDDVAAYDLKIGGTSKLAGNAVITKVSYGQDTEDKATIKIEAMMDGAPTITLA